MPDIRASGAKQPPAGCDSQPLEAEGSAEEELNAVRNNERQRPSRFRQC
jgi:hypothetical protein